MEEDVKQPELEDQLDNLEGIQEPELEDEGEQPELEDEGEDEDVITIGEETPPQKQQEEAPEWVKDLRKSHRQIQKENKELRKKLESKEQAQPAQKTVKKPTREECDFDDDLYDKKMEEYYKAKAIQDKQQAEAEQAWGNVLQSYEDKKKSLKVRDYEDSEAIVQDTLNEIQQGIILQGAENPAIVVYALGKDESRAKKLAAITDPIKFAFEVAKLETQMKVTRRRPSVEPEKIVTGTEKVSGSAHDKQLAKLRAKANETGDMTPVLEYKRKYKL